MQYITILIYAFFSVLGVVLFKLGSMQALTINISFSGIFLRISWFSVLGLAFYVISFLFYMGLVAKNNLSYLVPVATSVVYLLTMLSSVVIFHEHLQFTKVVGSILVLMGVVLMNIRIR